MTQEKREGDVLASLFFTNGISILSFCEQHGFDNRLFCKWLRGEEPIPRPTLQKILTLLQVEQYLFDWLLEHPVMDDVR